MRTIGIFVSACAVYLAVASCADLRRMPPGAGTEAGGGATSSTASQSVSGGYQGGYGGGGGGAAGAGNIGGGGHAGAGGGTEAGSVGVGGAGGGIMDPVPPAHADTISGSRLKARTWSGADGSRIWVPERFYDSTMLSDCKPKLAADGVLRCLPAIYYGGANYTPYAIYADASCTIHVVLERTCVSAPVYGVTGGPDEDYDIGCFSGSRVYRIGPALDRVYTNESGSCLVMTPAPLMSYYALGDEIPSSEFVEMTAQVEP